MGVNKDLIAYFRKLAISNTDLNGNFYRQNVEDTLFKPRTDVKYPYLSLEKAEYNLKNTSGSFSKKRIIAFCIVAKRDRMDGYEEELNLIDFCEDIADELIKKISGDVESASIPLIIGIDFNSISVVQLPFDATTGNVGFRVIIDIDQRFNNSINKEKWV